MPVEKRSKEAPSRTTSLLTVAPDTHILSLELHRLKVLGLLFTSTSYHKAEKQRDAFMPLCLSLDSNQSSINSSSTITPGICFPKRRWGATGTLQAVKPHQDIWEEAQWSSGLLQHGHHQELPTQCLKAKGNATTTVPHLTEWAYFLWNIRCKSWAGQAGCLLGRRHATAEQDTTLRKGRLLGNKSHVKNLVGRALWTSSGPLPCPKQGHDIKVMTLSPCFHCSNPSHSAVASFSIPTCKTELNRLIKLHCHRNEVEIITSRAVQLQPCNLHHSLISSYFPHVQNWFYSSLPHSLKTITNEELLLYVKTLW